MASLNDKRMNEGFLISLEEKQKSDADIGSASQEEEEEEDEEEDRKPASEVRKHLIFEGSIVDCFSWYRTSLTNLLKANLAHVIPLSTVRTPENLITVQNRNCCGQPQQSRKPC